MNALRIAALIAAPLLFAGCYSMPKEKTEYEKKIDAVPMPVTEADRLKQCRNFKRVADDQELDVVLRIGLQPNLSASDFDYTKTLALKRRLRAMKCPGYGWFS
ncbi:hypothetical protein [Pseudomonas sp. HN8-3]|uniref:hypothetical protein n=1 Tax=Pseudomonas sp. HN8-3 TaxID=2886361 RepID=UPI001E4907E2|nr:hypothetical protein [Pseudomonas sp. HN8-3]UEH06331.1 hypothetical protein LJX92_15280 [Pseudomonas sp. HN8-3]